MSYVCAQKPKGHCIKIKSPKRPKQLSCNTKLKPKVLKLLKPKAINAKLSLEL